MARIALNCSCGWNFFIPGSTAGHEVTCPSCAQTVRIPGRKPGKDVPLTAGAIAAEKQNQQRTIKLLVFAGIGVVVLVGIILAWVLGGSSHPADGTAVNINNDGNLTGFDNTRKTARSKNPDFDLPPPPTPKSNDLYTSAQIEELRRGVYANIWLANMSTVISECMRLRNLTNEWAQLQADVTNYSNRVVYNLGELAKVGEKVPVESYLAPGDQIFGFAQRDFTTMKPGDSANVIQVWVTAWRAGPNLEQVQVLRGDKKMTIYLMFPEDTKELLNLVRHPALLAAGTPGTGGTDSPDTGGMVAVPAEMIKDITGRFETLPPGYRSYLVPTDRKRMEDLLSLKRGTNDDLEWLKTRILTESIPSFQREADNIRSKVLELEPKLKDNVATDVIYRKNGTKVDGQIIQETAEFVKLKARFGSVTIAREEIEKVEKGKGAATEFPPKYAEAKGNLDKLVPLLAWCTDKGLKFEKEFVAYVILTLDASNDKARLVVGLARPAITTGGGLTPPKYPAGGAAGTRIDGVERAIEVIALDVTSRTQVFSDVVNEMRRRTESLTTLTAPPVPPEKSAKGVSMINNPLTFKPADMSTPIAVEIGSWWNGLTQDERRAFARYYGLWCAYMRSRSK